MFSKRSRYGKLKDIVSGGAGGRSVKSRSIRLLPDVSGTFLHMVEENDRLDHLAFKYYKQPGKWWRICDANPGVLSPLALLPKEPVIATRFPISFEPDLEENEKRSPPWYLIITSLSSVPGIRDVSIRESARLVKKKLQYNGDWVEVESEQFHRVLEVTYNTLNITVSDIERIIKDADNRFQLGPPEHIDGIGKTIVIPPDVVG